MAPAKRPLARRRVAAAAAVTSLVAMAALTAPLHAQGVAIDSTATSWAYASETARFRAEVVATESGRCSRDHFGVDPGMVIRLRPIASDSVR